MGAFSILLILLGIMVIIFWYVEIENVLFFISTCEPYFWVPVVDTGGGGGGGGVRAGLRWYSLPFSWTL